MPTPPKSRAPAVKYRKTDAGDHEIGVELEGAFVAFASVSTARAGQLIEREHDRSAAGEADAESEDSD